MVRKMILKCTTHKSAIIERFNRTLKTKMWQKLTEEQSNRWIDSLPDLLHEYNNQRHRTIGMTPAKASKKINEDKLMEKLYMSDVNENNENFKLGDWVRISRTKGKFEKGYTTNWTQEIFKIVKIKNTDPPTYKLEDTLGEPIQGSFYGKEMQKTLLGGVYLIENIIKTRRNKMGKKEMLVKWLGYDDPKFNEWIDESQMV